jgi:hypothetical protein
MTWKADEDIPKSVFRPINKEDLKVNETHGQTHITDMP